MFHVEWNPSYRLPCAHTWTPEAGAAGFSWVGLGHLRGDESTEGSTSRFPQSPGSSQLPRMLGTLHKVTGAEGRSPVWGKIPSKRVNVSSFYKVQMPTGASLLLMLLSKPLPLEKLWCLTPQLQTKIAQLISLREGRFTYKSNAWFSLCLITIFLCMSQIWPASYQNALCS